MTRRLVRIDRDSTGAGCYLCGSSGIGQSCILIRVRYTAVNLELSVPYVVPTMIWFCAGCAKRIGRAGEALGRKRRKAKVDA